MNFVGVDLHKQTISVCVVSQERKVSDRRTFRCRQPDRSRAYFAELGEFQAVIEATASYEWLWVLLDPLADRIVLAHPGKMRIIAESTRKSDKLDADVLAAFLTLDMIPQAYRPSPHEREHRVLVRRGRNKAIVPIARPAEMGHPGAPGNRRRWRRGCAETSRELPLHRRLDNSFPIDGFVW